MTTAQQLVRSLQEAVWAGSLPLAIHLSPADSRVYDQTEAYYTHCPRLAYLPFLSSKLHSFFQHVLIDPAIPASGAWFSFEGVPLKWHHPVGLLYDLFAGNAPAVAAPSTANQFSSPSKQSASSPLPWRLTVHYSGFPTDQLVPLDGEGKALHDAYINSVKEADFLRNGSASAIMKLNIADSTALWQAVVNHDLSQFAPIYARLLPANAELRHIPLRIYLPAAEQAIEQAESSAAAGKGLSSPSPTNSPPPSPSPARKPLATKPHLRVVQSLIPPRIAATREAQTLGSALNMLLPALFPSRRRVARARPVLHGAVVPMHAVLEELMRGAAYADGWLSLAVDLIV